MRLRTVLPALLVGGIAFVAAARPVCVEGLCYPSEQAARAAGVSDAVIARVLHPEKGSVSNDAPRVLMGYRDVAAFRAFLRGDDAATEADALGRHSVAVIVLLVLAGGLLANLTPCVLPLVPVNLILVGRGWRRGAAYGLGIALAYGALGLAAAFGGLAFGAIQASPWFNAAVAGVFALLALAMGGVFFLDLSKYRARAPAGGGGLRGFCGVFLLGAGAAVLAGACVEPILLATLLFTAKGFAAGRTWVVALPFVLGLGMALPWPFAAAGLAVLPRPGAWMRWVNRAFAGVLALCALWYGHLAWIGFRGDAGGTRGLAEATPATWPQVFAAARATGRPVLVDVWATWCKNCRAMERTTLRDPEVARDLARFAVVRVQAEDLEAFLRLPDFRDLGIKGLPAFVVFPAAATP